MGLWEILKENRSIVGYILVAVILVFLLTSYNADEMRASEVRASQQLFAEGFFSGVVFLKHPKIKRRCFVHYWRERSDGWAFGGGSLGGPAIATMPCKGVPADLIIEVEVGE